jgi:hypothetical protein
VKDAFQVTREDNTIMEFKPSAEGLHCYDFVERIRRKQKQETLQVVRTIVVQTVDKVKINFTEREREREREREISCG